MEPSQTIMVIEDDDAIRDLIAEVLRDAGHQVTEYATAREALVSLESGHPSLITLDLALPLMDGIEFLHLLRTRPDTASIPVVVLSAAPEELRFLLTDRVEATVGKPFHLDQLLGAVDAALGRCPSG